MPEERALLWTQVERIVAERQAERNVYCRRSGQSGAGVELTGGWLHDRLVHKKTQQF